MKSSHQDAMLKHATAVAHLACSDLPQTHFEYDRRLWEAFNHGREYEKALTGQQRDSAKLGTETKSR